MTSQKFWGQLSSVSPSTKPIASTGDPCGLGLNGPDKLALNAILLKPCGFSELEKAINMLIYH